VPPGALRANCVALSPDGKTVATGDANSTVYLWETSSGREARRLTGCQGGVAAIAFTLDGKRLASGDGDGGLRVWDLSTGKDLWCQTLPRAGVASALAFSPDGKLLAAPRPDGGTLSLWDADTGKEVRRLTDTGATVSAVAFTPDGKLLLSTDGEQDIRVWDVTTGRLLRRFGDGKARPPLAVSSDGKLLASGGGAQGQGIIFWDLASGERLRGIVAHEGKVTGLAFAPDGKRLISGGSDQKAHLWDVGTGQRLDVFGHPETRCESGVKVDWSRDGKTLALAGWDGLPRLHDAASGKELRTFATDRGPAGPLMPSPDGKTVAAVTRDRALRLWDAATGKEICTLAEFSHDVHDVAWSPDGKLLAVACEKAGVRRWDVASAKELAPLRADRHAAEHVSAALSAGVLASYQRNGLVFLWDFASGKQLNRLVYETGLSALAVSPAGRLLATAGEDRLVRLWDTTTGEEVRRCAGHHQAAVCLAFAPDGRTVASSSSDRSVRLWEVTTGKERARIVDEEFSLGPLAFSPDSRYLARGGPQRRVYVHVLEEEKEVRFAGHGDWVESLAYSRDGKRLYSGSWDRTALAWDVAALADERTTARRISATEAEEWWKDLMGDDGVKAYRAMWRLAAAPADALPLLRERLTDTSPAGAERVARLIADLDDDEFEVREKATEELKALGAEAERPLRTALEGKVSAEVVRRAEGILSLREREPLTPVQLAAVRGVEVLEQMRTPEARAFLERLGRGTPSGWLTTQATAALKRLAGH